MISQLSDENGELLTDENGEILTAYGESAALVLHAGPTHTLLHAEVSI